MQLSEVSEVLMEIQTYASCFDIGDVGWNELISNLFQERNA